MTTILCIHDDDNHDGNDDDKNIPSYNDNHVFNPYHAELCKRMR